MRINRKTVGLVLVSFGLGVVSNVIFSGMGFFMGVLIIALGAVELYCK